MHGFCLSNCEGCYLIWDYENLTAHDKQLCGGGVVPFYHASRPDWGTHDGSASLRGSKNTHSPYHTRINLTSGVYEIVEADIPLFQCILCKRPPFSSMVTSAVETDLVTSLVGFYMVLVSKKPATDESVLKDGSQLIVVLKQELARVLRVDETNLHVLSSYIATNHSGVIEMRVTQNTSYFDHQTTFRDFQVAHWRSPGYCPEENTTDSAGNVFTWNQAAPDHQQSHMVPGTQQIAGRKCKWNDSAEIQDVQWLNVEVFTVKWKPCSETEAVTDIELYSSDKSYIGHGAYLPMIVSQMIHLNNNKVSLNEFSSIIDSALTSYYDPLIPGPRKPLEGYLIDIKILPMLEIMLEKLVVALKDGEVALGNGEYNTMIALTLLESNKYVGFEAQNNSWFNQLEFLTSNRSDVMSPGTDLKVTVSESLLAANTRLAFTMFVHYNPTSNGIDYYKGLYKYVVQIVLHNSVNTSITSGDYVDVWVNNTLNVPYTKRTVASFDFNSNSWSTGNCDHLSATRSDLDVFRCRHFGHHGGTTRGYFHIYFHNATLSHKNPFNYDVVAGCFFTLIGVVTLVLCSAVFYKAKMCPCICLYAGKDNDEVVVFSKTTSVGSDSKR